MIETGRLRESYKNNFIIKLPIKPFREEGNIGKYPPAPTKKTIKLRKRLNKILKKALMEG